MKLNIKIITRGQINISVSVSDQYRRKAIQLMNTGKFILNRDNIFNHKPGPRKTVDTKTPSKF